MYKLIVAVLFCVAAVSAAPKPQLLQSYNNIAPVAYSDYPSFAPNAYSPPAAYPQPAAYQPPAAFSPQAALTPQAAYRPPVSYSGSYEPYGTDFEGFGYPTYYATK